MHVFLNLSLLFYINIFIEKYIAKSYSKPNTLSSFSKLLLLKIKLKVNKFFLENSFLKNKIQ